MTQSNPFIGATLADNGLSLPEIWQQLHSNAREWRDVPRNAKFFDIRDMIDQSDREVLRALAKVKSTDWQMMCDGAGWTGMGAVALTWCDDSTLIDAAIAWESSGAAVHPDSMTLRNVGLSSARVVPRSKSLAEILALASGNHYASALMIAASFEDVQMDIDPKYLANVPDILKPLINKIAGVEPEDISADSQDGAA